MNFLSLFSRCLSYWEQGKSLFQTSIHSPISPTIPSFQPWNYPSFLIPSISKTKSRLQAPNGFLEKTVLLPEQYRNSRFWPHPQTFMCLTQGLANSLYKMPDSKYFQLCWPYCLCCNESTLYHESRHRQYANKWAWLCSNKILFAKIGIGPYLVHGSQLP